MEIGAWFKTVRFWVTLRTFDARAPSGAFCLLQCLHHAYFRTKRVNPSNSNQCACP
jgi:hypothetical protein